MDLETFRVEFNEKQQGFHHSYKHQTSIPETHGWTTIIENCDRLEFKFFMCYIKRINKKKLTTEYLLKSLSEIKTLYNNLIENNLKITINK
jgi:hypothetical protein